MANSDSDDLISAAMQLINFNKKPENLRLIPEFIPELKSKVINPTTNKLDPMPLLQMYNEKISTIMTKPKITDVLLPGNFFNNPKLKSLIELQSNSQINKYKSDCENTLKLLIDYFNLIIIDNKEKINLQLNDVSLNCYYATNYDILDKKTKVFLKIKKYYESDPLINEVINTKILSIFDINSIFPKYIDHFLILQDCIKSDKPLNCYLNECLITELINKPKTLYDYLKDIRNMPQTRNKTYKQYAVLSRLSKALENYVKVVKDLGFIHNDLHSNNILIDNDGTGIFKIIDFGRSYMDPIIRCNILEKQKIDINNLFNKFNININFNPNISLKDKATLIDRNIICLATRFRVTNFSSEFDLDNLFGYMCDISQVAITTVTHIRFQYPDWLKIDTLNLIINNIFFTKDMDHSINNLQNINSLLYDQNINLIKTNLNLLFNDNKTDNDDFKYLYIGLYWYVCFANFKTLLNALFDKNLTEFFKNKIISINLYDLYNGNILLENGMFNPIIYEHPVCKNYMKICFQKLYTVFNELKPITISGGFKKKSKNNKKLIGGITESQFPLNPNQNTLIINHSKLIDFDEKTIEITPGIIPEPKNESLLNLYNENINQILLQQKTKGGSQKSYKIVIDCTTKRKYVRKSNVRWFLDENRGKYRFVDKDRKYILIKKSKK